MNGLIMHINEIVEFIPFELNEEFFFFKYCAHRKCDTN